MKKKTWIIGILTTIAVLTGITALWKRYYIDSKQNKKGYL